MLPATAASADSVRVNQQWVLDMMNVPAAWQLTQGAGVTVAVIDSGVNPDVSDLTGSVLTGPDYTGISTRPSNPDWGVHGTWMASLIAGHGHGPGGSSGVIGIAPRSTILSIRVIPDRADPHYSRYSREQEPGIQDSLARGIDFAVRHGAKVISMSIGYSAPNGAVKQALAGRLLPRRGGGRFGGELGRPGGAERRWPAPESFPADYPGVISVGAVNQAGDVAGFSSDNLSVQLAAPGVSVPAQGRDGEYWRVSGTSPACALVAGVAALIKSRYPDLAPNLVASALTSTTTGPAARRLRQPRWGSASSTRPRPWPRRPSWPATRPPRPASRRPPGSAAARPRSAAAPVQPARVRRADPVRPARADLPGPDRRRRHPPGPPAPNPTPRPRDPTDPADPCRSR